MSHSFGASFDETSATQASTASSELFGDEFLRRLERLRLIVRRTAPGGLHGEHRARRRGRGIEFCDFRPYVPGDDMRDLDWLAYLRFDKLLLRLFEEEGDLPIYMLLDRSVSMANPDRSKLDQALRVAAAIAYLALAQADRVSVVAFSDVPGPRLENLRGTGQLMRLLDFLGRIEPGGGTRLETAIRTTFAKPARRGLVVLASDFFGDRIPAADPSRDDDPAAERLFRRAFDWLVALRHDVLVLHLEQPVTEPPPFPRWLAIDAETGAEVRVEAGQIAFRRHQELTETFAEQLRRACIRRGWTYARTPTDQPFDDVVLRLFRALRADGPRR